MKREDLDKLVDDVLARLNPVTEAQRENMEALAAMMKAGNERVFATIEEHRARAEATDIDTSGTKALTAEWRDVVRTRDEEMTEIFRAQSDLIDRIAAASST